MLEGVTIEQLRTLRAVAEAGSFSAAARKLGRVQAAVSQSIDRLEAQLGLRLFDRTGRVPVLTRARGGGGRGRRQGRGGRGRARRAGGQLEAGRRADAAHRRRRHVPNRIAGRLRPGLRARAPGCRVAPLHRDSLRRHGARAREALGLGHRHRGRRPQRSRQPPHRRRTPDPGRGAARIRWPGARGRSRRRRSARPCRSSWASTVPRPSRAPEDHGVFSPTDLARGRSGDQAGADRRRPGLGAHARAPRSRGPPRAGRLVALPLEAWGSVPPRRSLLARVAPSGGDGPGRRLGAAASVGALPGGGGTRRPLTAGDTSHHPTGSVPAGPGDYTRRHENRGRHPPRAADRDQTATAGLRSVEGIHRSTTFHWVGNGFHVSTYFPSAGLPPERVSPFVLMDYGPPKEFAPLARGKRGVGWHPAPRLRDRDAGLGGRGRSPRQRRPRRRHRPGRRAVDDRRRAASSTRSITRSEFARAGRPHAHDAALGEPARARTRRRRPPTSRSPRPTSRGWRCPGRRRGAVIAGAYEGARGPARTFTPITMLDVRLARGRDACPSTLPRDAQRAGRGRQGARHGRASRGRAAGELVLFANDGDRLELVARRGEPRRPPRGRAASTSPSSSTAPSS